MRGRIRHAGYFYVVSSNGQPGGGDAPKGSVHVLQRIPDEPASGALTHWNGAELCLRGRSTSASTAPESTCLPPTMIPAMSQCIGSMATDRVGQLVAQPREAQMPAFMDIRSAPLQSNQTAILVTRGNNATGEQAGRSGRHQSLQLQGRRSEEICRPSRQETVWASDRGTSIFIPTKPGVRIHRAAEPTLCLRAEGRRNAGHAADVHRSKR